MNSITKFAVKYPVSVLMLTLAVCLLGTISYNKLGTDLFPDLKNPALYVEVKSGQRPPEEVEKLITTNVESTAARQEGVKSVYSVTKVGYTKVTVEYGWDQDMDAAFLDLQRSVSSLSQDETIEEVNVTRYDANATPIMTIALTHNEVKDMNELRKIAENYMRRYSVERTGTGDRRNFHESLHAGGIRVNCRRNCLANHGHQSKCFRGNDHGRRYSIHGERGKPDYQSPRY